MNATDFASSLLGELRQLDPRAASLLMRAARGASAVIGIKDDGEFVPLLQLKGASAPGSVMALFVRHHNRWTPTFQYGTPAELARSLAEELRHLWIIPLQMTNLDFQPPK